MELQGKEVPRDFLSLYSPGSSFQLQDPRCSSQGTPQLVPNIPLEQKEKCEEGVVEDGGIRFPLERPAELGLSSNVGGCGVGRVGKAVAKQESSTVRLGIPIEVEVKPEPDYGSWSTTTSYGSHAGGVSHALWDNKDTAFRGQGPSVFAAASSNCLPEAIPKDLTTKVEGKVRSANQTPNTPRSKHSATEQRRRSKINNRFQILREIIPLRDQKRDKASFLLEVIEYIRFLQEKIEKFEASHRTWNQDNAKLIPWVNHSLSQIVFLPNLFPSQYSLSRQKSCQATTNGLSILSEVTRHDSAPPVNMFSKKSEAVRNSVGVPTQSSMQCSPAIGMVCGNSSKTMETASNNLLQPRLFTIGSETISQSPQRLIRNPVDMVFQDRSPWLRLCNLNEKEELAIDDGTISISTAYTHRTLHALSQALQSTGVDLTQAGISVQINLGNRAINRRSIATASTVKESRDPASINQATCGYIRSEKFNIDEQSQAPKRHKAENC